MKRRSSGLKRTQMRRKPKPSKTDPALASAWWRAVTKDAKGKTRPCIVCGLKRRIQGHHVLDQQVIEDFALGAGLSDAETQTLLWDPDNGVPVCAWPCHARHTSAMARISFAKLPARAIAFAERLGLGHRLSVYAR